VILPGVDADHFRSGNARAYPSTCAIGTVTLATARSVVLPAAAVVS
jgi:hypothetical protein